MSDKDDGEIEQCEKCGGDGAVSFDGEMIRCPACDGNGYHKEGFINVD